MDDYRTKTISALKNIKNELRHLKTIQKMRRHKLEKIDRTRAEFLFIQKRRLTDTILYLNTAFSLIDKMFQQEIINAELRKNSPIFFWVHDTVRMCCPRYGKNFCLPHNYMPPDQCGGDILRKVMGNDNHIDITDEDIENISCNQDEH